MVKEIEERVVTQHEQWAGSLAGSKEESYTGAVVVDVGEQVACYVYGFGGCSGHQQAAEQALQAHLESGRPYPSYVLVYGACHKLACPCRGQAGFEVFRPC